MFLWSFDSALIPRLPRLFHYREIIFPHFLSLIIFKIFYLLMDPIFSQKFHNKYTIFIEKFSWIFWEVADEQAL